MWRKPYSTHYWTYNIQCCSVKYKYCNAGVTFLLIIEQKCRLQNDDLECARSPTLTWSDFVKRTTLILRRFTAIFHVNLCSASQTGNTHNPCSLKSKRQTLKSSMWEHGMFERWTVLERSPLNAVQVESPVSDFPPSSGHPLNTHVASVVLRASDTCWKVTATC